MNRKRILSLLEAARWPSDVASAGATRAQIEECEERVGVEFPKEMREWLAISNGPRVARCDFYGTERDYFKFDDVYEIFPEWTEREWIPILNDGCGNYWVMVTQEEFGEGRPIVFVKPISDREAAAYIVASDLEHFLEFVLEKEILSPELGDFEDTYWPFDQDKVLAKDPDLLSFRDVPLPWDA
ncbi:MAG: hypothetical protein C0483_25290 [Pirellula sp.]|nr:hypothetical protein [Pirellula sp.]